MSRNQFILVFLIAAFLLIGAGSPLKETRFVHLILPERTWSLDVGLPDFALEGREWSDGAEAFCLQAFNKMTGVRVSIFLEKAASEGDSKAAREYYWKKAQAAPWKYQDVESSEKGPMALVAYTAVVGPAKLRHVNGYLAKDDIWIDIHLSKGDYESKDAALFDAVLDSALIDEKYVFVPLDYVNLGEAFFETGQYPRAAGYFQKALDLDTQLGIEERERRGSRLSEMQWRYLVNHLGITHAMAGDLEKAKTTFEHAISEDPKFPLFTYNLACTYADMNDLDTAIANLKKAFEIARAQKDDSLPDPRKDSSFKRHLEDPKLKQALSEIDATKQQAE